MIIDIFSSFDPETYSSSSYPTTFWLRTMVPLLLINASFWVAPRWVSGVLKQPLLIMSNQVQRTTGSRIKGFNSILTPLFIMVISCNLFGLLPYVFSASSHLILTLVLSVPLWLILLISALSNAPKSTVANLLPANTPDWLSPPLIIIELVRILVRPLTLAFRLSANIRAGHIVLSLIGIYFASIIFVSKILPWGFLIVIVAYMLFEVGICLVQAYIFCLLLSLYSDDHPAN